jgi:hypothetical protein
MIGWCYQVGIDKPDWDTSGDYTAEMPTFSQYLSAVTPPLQTSTRTNTAQLTHRLAQSFTCPTYELTEGSVSIWISDVGSIIGAVRVKIVTDNAGEPSTTLAFTDAVSGWRDMSEITDGVHGVLDGSVETFNFLATGELSADTTYWLVLEGDANYIADYLLDTDYVGWDYDTANPYANGSAMTYNGTTWSSIATSDFMFNLALAPPTTRIFYQFTHFNSTHEIESQPTEEFALTLWSGPVLMVFPAIDDDQVTHVNVYRRQYDSSSATWDADYSYVGRATVDASTTFVDTQLDATLGLDLQSTNHRRFSDSDDNLLVPRYLEHWQGRIHAIADNDNTDYFSKKLEGVGVLGVAGDSIYDYFPAENNWELDSEIRAIRKRGEDELVVYTSDNDIHVFRGGNSPLNPPPDLAHQPMFIGENCADSRSLVSIGAHHIYVTSNNNIRAFSGGIDEQVTAEELGTAIKTSMDAIGSVYSAAIYDNQYVLAVDADDDGVLDTLYILDLSQRIPAWREAVYYDNASAQLDLYHIHVTRAGVILACPADLDSSDFHVIQLDSGTSDDWVTTADDGVDITQTVQTQFIIPARRARWNKMILTGLYPSTANIPTLTMTATDKSSNTSTRALEPTGSEDVRGHTSGVKLFSEECAITITSVGDRADEIRGIFVEWGFN